MFFSLAHGQDENFSMPFELNWTCFVNSDLASLVLKVTNFHLNNLAIKCPS